MSPSSPKTTESKPLTYRNAAVMPRPVKSPAVYLVESAQ